MFNKYVKSPIQTKPDPFFHVVTHQKLAMWNTRLELQELVEKLLLNYPCLVPQKEQAPIENA